MKSNTTEEWIENYLDRKLSEPELREFNERRKNDPEFDSLCTEQVKLRDDWRKAGQLHQTRIEVAGAIRKEKNRKKKVLYIWASAASILLIISISGVIYWNDNNYNQPSFADQNKEYNSETYDSVTPQFKEIEEKASFGTADTLMLLGPANNQKCNISHYIVFRWKPALIDSTNIVIKSLKNDNVVFREKIGPGNLSFILEKGFLPVGDYVWHLQDSNGKAQFKVISNNDISQ